MTAQFPARIRAWLADIFYCETPGQAADAMADATRWGWLPALSGVAIAADQARVEHANPAQGQAGCLVEHTIAPGRA